MNTTKIGRLNIQSKTIETAGDIATNILQDTNNTFGSIPNMYGLMANNPALLDAYAHSYHTFRENAGFTSVEQEVIFMSVAYENECDYCMGAHSFVADKMSGVPEEVTNAIRAGEDVPDEKLSALSVFARLVTKNRGRVTEEEITTFLATGYTENQILGVITGVGVKTFSNYFNHVAHTPLDDIFQERAWSKN